MAELYQILFASILCASALADGGYDYPYPPSVSQELPGPPSPGVPPASYGPPSPPASSYGSSLTPVATHEGYEGNHLHYGPTDGGYGPPPNLIEHANHPSYFTGTHLAHVGYWIGAVWDKIITFLEPFAFLGLIANGIYVTRMMLPPLFFGTLTPHVVARERHGKQIPDPTFDSSVELFLRQLVTGVSNNVCMERVACKSGISTGPYLPSSAQTVVKNLNKLSPKFGKYTHLVSIYSDAASGRFTNCAQFTCKGESHDESEKIASIDDPANENKPANGKPIVESANQRRKEDAIAKQVGTGTENDPPTSAVNSETEKTNLLDLSKSPRKFPKK